MSEFQSCSKKTESGEDYIVWSEYYQAYKNWCLANGDKPETMNKFTKTAIKEIPDFKRRYIVKKVDGKATRVLMGYNAKMPGGF